MRGFFEKLFGKQRYRSGDPAPLRNAELVFAQAVTLHEGYRRAPSAARLPDLLQAIELYRGLLEVWTERHFPVQWAGTQTNLGSAYAQLPTGDRARNLEQAIACYRAALRVHSERHFPVQWATTQNNLGNAYRELPTGDRARNLEQAIACYRAALRVYTEQDFPADWAMTQNNLGAAYTQLPTGDRARNLEQAIACFEAALRVFTEHEFPADWAMTQNNLGVAYRELPTGDRSQNLEQAIACYRAALRVYTEQDFPVEWAGTQNNLGVAYRELPTGDRARNLEQAIACYRGALRVYTEQNFPVDWARTQNNLGNEYSELPTGDRARNLEQAIACYQAALRVFTERDFPVEWARTQNNLGVAYSDLPTGDRARNLEQAIACYRGALRVFTPERFPFECQQTLNDLSRLFFEQQDWERACEASEQAMGVSEQIRAAALDEDVRREYFHQSWQIFERGVLSAARCEKYTLALNFTERGKTRNLADVLWQREVKPRGVSETDWQEYQKWLARQRAEESGRGMRERGAPGASAQMLEERETVRRKIAEFEARFQQADPDYVPLARPLAVEQIAALAQATAAVIVDFRITSEGGLVFLVGPGDRQVSREQVVELPAFNSEALRRSSIEWLRVYYEAKLRRQWEPFLEFLEAAGARLYGDLWAPVHERFKERYPQVRRLILVPNQGLSLLPLHAAWRQTPEGKRRYLVDDYEIAYAPSCLVLQRCLERQKMHAGPARSLFAVQNPDGTLPFADWEVEEAAKMFLDRQVYEGSRASLAAVKAGIGYGEEKLFACHGEFNPWKPEESHLKLHDGRLRLPEVMPLDLRVPWLIVLSACETALVGLKGLAMDEYYGLPAAFLAAGAQTVVAGLWTVDDVSTALLSQRFHANLYQRGMAKAAALREAQLWLRDLSEEEADRLLAAKQEELAAGVRMAAVDAVRVRFELRRRGPRPFASPYYWAAFQCIGAGWPSASTEA